MLTFSIRTEGLCPRFFRGAAGCSTDNWSCFQKWWTDLASDSDSSRLSVWLSSSDSDLELASKSSSNGSSSSKLSWSSRNQVNDTVGSWGRSSKSLKGYDSSIMGDSVSWLLAAGVSHSKSTPLFGSLYDRNHLLFHLLVPSLLHKCSSSSPPHCLHQNELKQHFSIVGTSL